MFTKTSVRKEGNSLKLESVIYKIQRKTAYNPTRTISSSLERNKTVSLQQYSCDTEGTRETFRLQ